MLNPMEKGIKVTGGWFDQSFVLSFETEKDFINDRLENSVVFIRDDEKTRRLKLKGIYTLATAKKELNKSIDEFNPYAEITGKIKKTKKK